MAETPVKNRRFRRNADTAIPSENEYSDNREVYVRKHCPLEFAEVEQERLDSIKNAVDNFSNISSESILSDVILGISTTFLGAFLGCIPDIWNMIASNAITPVIFFYFVLLLITVVSFFAFTSNRRKSHATIVSLIDTLKRETDSIFRSLATPDNEFREALPSSDLGDTLDKE